MNSIKVVVVFLLFWSFKTIAVRSEPKPFHSSRQHLSKDFGGLFADASESTPNQSIDTYQHVSDSPSAAARKEQQQRQLTASRPILIRTMIRTMDNGSIKLRSAPPVQDTTATRWLAAQNDTFKSANPQHEESNLKADPEGFSSNYGGLNFSKTSPDSVQSEPVKSYNHFSAPLSSAGFITFQASPQIQRVIEQVPVPVEVFHTIERQVPVLVPIVREVTREMPVPVFQQVPVPFLQPIPFTIDRPVFIERRIPFPETMPLVQRVLSPLPPPSAIRSTIPEYPLTLLKERILGPFSGVSFGRFGRFLRRVSTCCRSSSRHFQ